MRIKVEIKTPSQKNVLNLAQINNFKIEKISKCDEKVFATFSGCTKKELSRILDADGFQYKIISFGGVRGFANSCLRRIGLVIGGAVFTAFVAISSFFVVDIQVFGGQNEESIKRLLSENGVSAFGLKSNYDKDSIENLLQNNIEDAGLVSVQIVGGVLRVNIVEQLPYKDPENITAKQIFSAYDGVVSRVLVMSGEAMVKEGDRVLRGSPLIDGKYSYDDNEYDDIPPVVHEVAPKGQVFGRVWYKSSFFVADKEMLRVPTGKSVSKTVLSLGHLETLPTLKTDFSDFDTSVTKKVIKGIFPVFVYTVKVSEMTTVEDSTPYDVRMERRLFEAMQELALKIPKQAKHIKDWTISKKNGNICNVELYFEVEHRIDVRVD